MRAAVLTDALRIEPVDRARPALRPVRARIRIGQRGACASEVDVWTGKAPDELPATIGHEIAGVVEEIGSDARGGGR